jgi:hypothetical protein
MTRKLLIILIGSAACEQAPPEHRLAIRDSAGVSIVHNGAPTIDTVVLSGPSIRLGGSVKDAERQLFRVRGAAQLSNGHIAVLNSGTYEIRTYTSAGEPLASLGRRGSGPGEFLFPVMITKRGDSVHVFDPGGPRFTVIDAWGKLVRTYPASGTMSGFAGFVDDQKVLSALPNMRRVSGNQLLEAPMVVRTIDIETGSADTIGVFGGRKEYQLIFGEEIFMVPVPFTVYPSVAARDGNILVTDGISPEVRMYNVSGQLLRIFREDLPAHEVSDADVARFVKQRLDQESDALYRNAVAAAYSGLPKARRMPAYERMLVASNGNIWAQQFTSDDSLPAIWSVFNGSGSLVAHVMTPAKLKVVDIGAESLVGITTDELDREFVEVYTVNPPYSR